MLHPESHTDALPPVVLSNADQERLLDLAGAALERIPHVAKLLLDEADRATVVPSADLPPDIVGVRSHVEYLDGGSGEVHRVQIVYPHEADIGRWKISVLTLIGAGLIGLRTGQSIEWPTQSGQRRTLTVLQVGPTPFEPAPGSRQAAEK